MPNDLVTLTHRRTEFEAHTIVAVLKNAGIEAHAFGMANAAWGTALTPADRGVPIQVRRGDLERAQQVIDQNVEDSVDLDWDEVDVGEREDDLPLNTPGRMPPAIRVAFAVTLLLVLLYFVAGAIGLFGGPSSGNPISP